MTEREIDPIDVGRQTSELMLQDAISKVQAEANKKLPAIGKCWNCELQFKKDSELRFCLNEDGKGSDCRDEYYYVLERRQVTGR